MLMNTVIAVALGYAPLNGTGPEIVQANPKAEQMIGSYNQYTDKNGVTHVTGLDRLGRLYQLTLDRSGHVYATIGIWDVAFDVSEPA